MKTLQEKVQEMLNGESKRREIAIKWLEEVAEVLLPVATHIWGSGDFAKGRGSSDEYTKTISYKDTQQQLFFRYKIFDINDKYEGRITYPIGFYYGEYNNSNGTALTEINGKEFWSAIQKIMDWIPDVIDAMDKRNISRDELVSKLNTK